MGFLDRKKAPYPKKTEVLQSPSKSFPLKKSSSFETMAETWQFPFLQCSRGLCPTYAKICNDDPVWKEARGRYSSSLFFVAVSPMYYEHHSRAKRWIRVFQCFMCINNLWCSCSLTRRHQRGGFTILFCMLVLLWFAHYVLVQRM